MGRHQSRRSADPLAAAVERLGKRRSRPKAATVLKQYELLRAEVTTSLQLQQQILTFGIATIGLLAGAAFVGHSDAHRSDLLVIFVPLVAYLAVTIWFAEVMRMLRAGAFMLILEKRLDDCGDGSLTWEFVVARARPKGALSKLNFFTRDPDQLRLIAVTLLFLTLAAASIVLGWADASTGRHVFAVFVGVVAVTVLLRLFRLRVAQLEELLDVRRRKGTRTRRRALLPRLTHAAAGGSRALVVEGE